MFLKEYTLRCVGSRSKIFRRRGMRRSCTRLPVATRVRPIGTTRTVTEERDQLQKAQKAQKRSSFLCLLWLISFLVCDVRLNHIEYVPDHKRVTFSSGMNSVTNEQFWMSLNACEEGDYRDIQFLGEVVKI
jgi:hypothetical protein